MAARLRGLADQRSRRRDRAQADGHAHPPRPRRRLIFASAWIVGADAAGAAPTLIDDCTDATLRSAVAGGGIVQSEVDCADLQLGSALVIGAGADVDIRARSHHVVLDGHGATRHFVVDGATLAMSLSAPIACVSPHARTAA